MLETVDGCIRCGESIPCLLTWAHDNDDITRKRKFRLCWNCHHGLYDNELLTTAELEACQQDWDQGIRREGNPINHRIAADLKAGILVRKNVPAARAHATLRARKASLGAGGTDAL